MPYVTRAIRIIGLICACGTTLLASGACRPYCANKLLPAPLAQDANVAIVVDLEYRSPHGRAYWNDLNLFLSMPSEAQAGFIRSWAQPLAASHGDQLVERLGEVARQTLGRLLPLDRGPALKGAAFPIVRPAEYRFMCAEPRDFWSLSQQGYTHALLLAFPTTFQHLPQQDERPILYVGLDTRLLDLRGSPPADHADLERRILWRYYIKNTPTTHSVTSAPVTFANGDQYTFTQTYSTRECLNLVAERREGGPYSLAELFGGPRPLFVEATVRAARINLTKAALHLSQEGAAPVAEHTSLGLLLDALPD